MELVRQPIFLLVMTAAASFSVFLSTIYYFGFGEDQWLVNEGQFATLLRLRKPGDSVALFVQQLVGHLAPPRSRAGGSYGADGTLEATGECGRLQGGPVDLARRPLPAQAPA